MNVPNVLLSLCFVALMALGAFLAVYSLIRLTRHGTHSELKIPGLNVELKGPAWLIATLVGCLMVASPILVGALSKPQNVTAPPPPTLVHEFPEIQVPNSKPSSAQEVQQIPEPDYKSFRFIRDVSVLDLRATFSRPWYAYLPGFSVAVTTPRIRPAVLRNYFVVRKIEPVDRIHFVFATSGQLDVQCLTHPAAYQYAVEPRGDSEYETWEVTADVSSVPVGRDFDIAVEATYWNAFVGGSSDSFTTSSEQQSEAVSVILLFPENKPFKDVSVTEQPSDHAHLGADTFYGYANRTLYWSTVSSSTSSYRLAWTW